MKKPRTTNALSGREAATVDKRAKSLSTKRSSSLATESAREPRQSTSRTPSHTASSTVEKSEEKVPYFVSSKPDTDPAVFDAFLESMSYQGDGPMARYSNVPWQSQIVSLTAEEARAAKELPFMLIVDLVTEPEEEDDARSPHATGHRQQTGSLD